MAICSDRRLHAFPLRPNDALNSQWKLPAQRSTALQSIHSFAWLWKFSYANMRLNNRGTSCTAINVWSSTLQLTITLTMLRRDIWDWDIACTIVRVDVAIVSVTENFASWNPWPQHLQTTFVPVVLAEVMGTEFYWINTASYSIEFHITYITCITIMGCCT